MRSLLLNLSIKKRLILSFSVLLLLTFCLSMAQLWSSNTQNAVVDNMYKHPLTVTRASGLAYSSVLKIDASVKELLYNQKSESGNDDEAKKAISLAEKQIAEHLSIVGKRILGDEGKKIHKAAGVQFELFVNYVNVLTAGETFSLDEYKEYTKEQKILERQLLAIVEYAKVKADGFYDASKVEMETAIYRTVISLLLVIALGIGIAVVVYRSILKPILLFKSTIEHVEEHSDLGKRLDFEAGCEIGEMARSFDRMMETIQQSIRFGLDASTTIETSNQKVSAQTLSIANSIENQATEVGKVAMSVSELTQTIQHVAQNAADTLAKANDANKFADKGDGVIKELASDVSGLSTSAKATTDLVNQLQEDVSNIDSILDVICGIADQTNLLALNAAIEAARAGEQGRGFAVVADEVRTLAVRTTKSTSEIQATIERLQVGTKQVVLSIEQNTSLIQEGVNKADNASIQVNLIRETINEISDMNAQMAQETQNQAQMSQEIDESVQTISTLSKEASDNANDIAKQNADLLTQSRNLHSAMTQFRLSPL